MSRRVVVCQGSIHLITALSAIAHHEASRKDTQNKQSQDYLAILDLFVPGEKDAEFARLIADPDHSEKEDRFILLGTSIHSRLLVVCHCVRTNDSIRIISARKADKQERKLYEVFRHA